MRGDATLNETQAAGSIDRLAAHKDTVTEKWRLHAACRGLGPDLFFPDGTTGVAAIEVAAAKAVCRKCVSRQPCLEFALSTNQEDGVWGGTGEAERLKLRKRWLKTRETMA